MSCPRRRCSISAGLRCCATGYTACVMPTAGADRRSMLIVAGILQHLLRQLRDRRRHRRAEEERLPLGRRRNVFQHPPDVGEEAHVQHAVGFVEDQVLQTAEPGVRRAEVVQQTARRRHDHVDAAAKGVLLGSHADAAEDGRRRQRRVHGEIVEILDDLRRQFACGREHERSRRPSRLTDESVEYRQQEGRRLAAAGHRAREQILPGHRQRDRVGLNGCRSGKTEILQSLKEAGMQPEFREWHGTL